MTVRDLLGTPLEGLVQAGLAVCVAEGLAWGEGPAWLPAEDIWVFSDIPNDRILAWSQDKGLRVFRAPSQFANGNVITGGGDLLTCEHLTRRVVRRDARGRLSVVCDRYNGRRLNSPNDVIEMSDGSIWFSDPLYGILTDVEGRRAAPEQPCCGVYRVDGRTGAVSLQIDGLKMPNGLCVSRDGSRLYVADSGADMGPEIGFDPNGPREVFVFDLKAGAVDGAGRLFARIDAGAPDGIRIDMDDCLWVAAGDGVRCYDPDGHWLGVIATPEIASNLCFGGRNGGDLLITLARSAYLVTAAESG